MKKYILVAIIFVAAFLNSGAYAFAASDPLDCGDQSSHPNTCQWGYSCSLDDSAPVGQREGVCEISDTLDCSDSSSHPNSCPSGYSCAHQSGGVGVCTTNTTSQTQCTTPDPSNSKESCRCDMYAGSMQWICSANTYTPPVCTGAKPVEGAACSCVAGTKVDPATGKTPGVWDCGNIPASSANTTGTNSNTPSGASTKKITYSPLEPLPGLENVQDLNFAQFLGTIFKLLITAGALLAVGTLVYAGISYILSEAFETKGEAKKRMQAAIFGLIILLGAWLMLYTVNPTLLNFNLNSIGTTGSIAPSTQTSSQPQPPPNQSQINTCEGTVAQPTGKHYHLETGSVWVCY